MSSIKQITAYMDPYGEIHLTQENAEQAAESQICELLDDLITKSTKGCGFSRADIVKLVNRLTDDIELLKETVNALHSHLNFGESESDD